MRTFFLIREINRTVNVANEVLAQGGQGPRWTWFATNRSFIAAVVGVILSVAGLIAPAVLAVPPGEVEAVVYAVGILAVFAYSAYQRLSGKSRAVWNQKQASDALSEALAEAMVSGK